jgi:hypothetical protein
MQLTESVATGDETPFDPSERDIYADLPRNTRRQARRLEAIAAEREAAEAAFNTPLREDVQATLEDAHAAHIGRAKAQLEHHQAVVDAAYQAAQAAAPPQLFVKRGGEWAKVKTRGFALANYALSGVRMAKWKPLAASMRAANHRNRRLFHEL